MIRGALRILVTVELSAIVLASVVWGALALWLDGPDSKILAGTMAVGLVLVSILLVALVRPFPRGLGAALCPSWLSQFGGDRFPRTMRAIGRRTLLALHARLLGGPR